MTMHKELKAKKRKEPKMILRLFDPRDDRIGGNEENDDGFEQTSPLIVKQMPRNKVKKEK